MAFQFLLCTSAFLALGALIMWHAKLIHSAETSIESHTNRLEAARQRKLGLVSSLMLVTLTPHTQTKILKLKKEFKKIKNLKEDKTDMSQVS